MMRKDMTQGKPVTLILSFAVPLLIGNVFQQIYSLVDTIIVGRYLGADALAGIGATGTITFFMTSLLGGMYNGAGIVLAQFIGGKKIERMKQCVTALLYIAAFFILFISIIGVPMIPDFLKLLNIPDNVQSYSMDYLRIIWGMIGGSVVYNATSSILRSSGDSKTPLIALIVACLLNVVLDLIFILKLGMGVKGAAYATIIAQVVSAAICSAYLIFHRRQLQLEHLDRLPRGDMLLLILRTGLPSAFQSCAISIGSISVQRLINSCGEIVMAGYTAAVKIDGLAIQVICSIGAAISVYSGQNMGNKNIIRIKQGLYATLKLMIAASLIIALLVLCFKSQIMGIFLDPAVNGEAIEIGAAYLSVMGIAYVIAGIMQSYQNLIKGAGDVNACLVAGMCELTARILFAYLLFPHMGQMGIWIATPISWGCGCLIPVYRYYSGKWKEKAIA